MNVHIAKLHLLPRGKPHRSRLLPFIEEIRRWREQDVPYRQIALSITQRGLPITGAAVNGFVKARDARRSRHLFRLSPAMAVKSEALVNTCEEHIVSSPTDGESEDHNEFTEPVITKKHKYVPDTIPMESFTDDELSINNPADLLDG